MSHRLSLVLTSLTLVALVPAAVALGRASRAADTPELLVTFNADKSVTVTDGNGNAVGTSSGAPTVIPPGTYNVLISDPSFVSDVQWDLAGPGVKLVTTMSSGEEISEAWVEAFQPNSTYTYRDDNRPPAFWTFVTSSTPATTTTGPESPPASTTPISSGNNGKTSSTNPLGSGVLEFQGTLTGSVTAAGKASLSFKGKTVSTLQAGIYTFKVTDKSAAAGFTVQQNKHAAKVVTTEKFKGTKSVKVTLAAGQWFFYPTLIGKKSFFLVET